MGIKDFEPNVMATLPRIVALVPKKPAAHLARWEPQERPHQYGTRVQAGLNGLGGLLAERLLGALELTVDGLVVDIPPDLTAGLVKPMDGRFGVVTSSSDSETSTAVAILEHVHPGATDLVVDLVEALRDKAAVPEATGDEMEIAAQHGASHLALAVVVATAVLRSLGPVETAAIVGVALGATAIVLPGAPKPPAYAAAVREKRRAEYLLPRMSSATVLVANNRFWLTEGSVPSVDFASNGLVAVVPDGVAVRTGMAEGHVRVHLEVRKEPPSDVDLLGWDEVVETSWTAPEGGAVFGGETGLYHPHRPRFEAPPWPGNYRIRVHARSRDEDDESYQLSMWQAPTEPDVIHKKTDALGHRLRGEPEPPVVAAPEAEFRWLEKSAISEAATITVVRGLTRDEVIRVFGGNPESPVSIQAYLRHSALAHNSGGRYEPLLNVLEVDGYVVALEDNGFQGAQTEILRELSRGGRAASVYWNVNALFRVTAAEGGVVVYADEPRGESEVPYGEDVDFADYRHLHAKGLLVVARFVGRGMSAADLAAIQEDDRGYLLTS